VPPRRGSVIGLDLAGSPGRRTGFCRLGPGLATRTAPLAGDAEILDAVRSSRPSIVAIDAPLSLPAGRLSLDIPGPPHLRQCDRELQKLGIRFFPVTLGPMRMLTARGIALARRFRADGFTVIEAYPGGAQDVLGIPRKGAGVETLRRALVRFGFRGDVERRAITHDELDAVVCAYTGREHLAGRSLVLGDPAEGELVLPRPLAVRGRPAPPRRRST
jgi:uncharacterized protein